MQFLMTYDGEKFTYKEAQSCLVALNMSTSHSYLATSLEIKFTPCIAVKLCTIYILIPLTLVYR